ncbi:MAG TPA: TetR/AcrR family transcriptional regulator [Acidimicrobiales bacterium]|nr:TetR/AcrR family transcriptional regulator [Acidimicrobiales bacterium]
MTAQASDERTTGIGTAVSDAGPLHALLGQLPARPPAQADRALDALSVCLARHGLARTTMTDVARQMGVARSTLYKQFGSIEQAAWALLAREAYRFFDEFGDLVARRAGPEEVVALTARFVRFASTHPVLARLLHDEPAFVGAVMTRSAAATVDYAAGVVTPLMARAIEAGMLRQADPARLAQWMGRIVAICIIAPPPGDLDEWLREMLLPVLRP